MGAQIVIWTFYDQVVKVEKGWVEQEFVLLIILALPNEQISYRGRIFSHVRPIYEWAVSDLGP